MSDTGTGIPAHEHKRVFERFYQIDSARTNVQGGTGLGLSIAKHIVEAQGGTIWVEGVDPQGACLCFTLISADRSDALETVDMPTAAMAAGESKEKKSKKPGK